MKNTNFILAFLFFAVLGTVFSIGLDISPIFGATLGFAAYIPMPTGIVGMSYIPNTELTDEENAELEVIYKLDERIKKEIKKAELGLITKEGLKLKLDAIDVILKEIKDKGVDMTKFQKSFNELAADVQKISEQRNNLSNEKDGLKAALKEAWDTMKTDIEGKKNSDINRTLTIKALPLTTATWAASTNYPFLPDDQEVGITNEPRSPQTFRNDVPTGQPIGANSDVWTWIERSTIVDNTGTVAEGGTFGTVEVAYLKKETKVRKIGNFTKITREMLEDWDEFLEAVNDLIATLNNEKLNTQLFIGDGTGVNLSGIKINSVEFDANGKEFTAPDIFGVIRTTITQIIINGLTKWMPNKIYMHPSDMNVQELSKDTTGNYVFPPFIMPNGLTVKGIIVTETTDVDEGFFEICDMSRARKRFKRELELRIWEQNATDVQDDLLTITGSLRVAFRIKDLEKPAFVYDSFDAAIAIMTNTAAALAMIIAVTTGMAQNGIGDASKLTINLLAKAGVTSLVAATLPAYKVDVAAAASIADLAALQVIIDAA